MSNTKEKAQSFVNYLNAENHIDLYPGLEKIESKREVRGEVLFLWRRDTQFAELFEAGEIERDTFFPIGKSYVINKGYNNGQDEYSVSETINGTDNFEGLDLDKGRMNFTYRLKYDLSSPKGKVSSLADHLTEGKSIDEFEVAKVVKHIDDIGEGFIYLPGGNLGTYFPKVVKSERADDELIATEPFYDIFFNAREMKVNFCKRSIPRCGAALNLCQMSLQDMYNF
ncbi:hypothetical protein KY321_04835 [Candidatus Woesearchaeota archaeon]|nr:hypothetical protein [Candidatus Woesearchaeota archaeon]